MVALSAHALEKALLPGADASATDERTSTTVGSVSSPSCGGAESASSLDVVAAMTTRKRTVSFQLEADVVELYEVPGFNDVAGPVPSVDDMGAIKSNADVKVFCVHCGKQVASELLKMGTKFCTYCGQQHPSNLLQWASGMQSQMPSEEASHLCGGTDWLAKLVESHEAQAMPIANSQSQFGMQEVPWKHLGCGPSWAAHTGHSMDQGAQHRPQHAAHGPARYGAYVQNAGPAYVHCGQ